MPSIEKRLISKAYRAIYRVVLAIPRGRVMTYGQVARAAGLGRAARLVGTALRTSPRRLPWQRVLGSRRAGVAQVTIGDPAGAVLQRRLLEKEGVRFTPSDGVELDWFGWSPGGPKRKKPAR